MTKFFPKKLQMRFFGKFIFSDFHYFFLLHFPYKFLAMQTTYKINCDRNNGEGGVVNPSPYRSMIIVLHIYSRQFSFGKTCNWSGTRCRNICALTPRSIQLKDCFPTWTPLKVIIRYFARSLWLILLEKQTKNTWAQISKSLEKSEAEVSKQQRRKSDNRRRPLHPIQPIMAKEAAKLAREKSRKQQPQSADDSANVGGVLDKIEQMLEEGKYRPDGVQRTAYRIRRKGQPTVYVNLFFF